MGKYFFLIFFLFGLIKIEAQTKIDTVDLKYLEDQIYVSLTYNILTNKPKDISQNGFSGGISIGFIKDIPFNSKRNYGLGIGLGYAYNADIQNLKISRENKQTVFELAQDYDTNRLVMHSLELPIEIRWRNSTPVKYRFWRIYGGFKFSYLFSIKSKYEDTNGIITTKNIPEFNKLQYGITLATGYSTWNIYLYYGLNTLFKDTVKFENENLKLNEFNVGLKFYIM